MANVCLHSVLNFPCEVLFNGEVSTDHGGGDSDRGKFVSLSYQTRPGVVRIVNLRGLRTPRC